MTVCNTTRVEINAPHHKCTAMKCTANSLRVQLLDLISVTSRVKNELGSEKYAKTNKHNVNYFKYFYQLTLLKQQREEEQDHTHTQ